MRNFKVFMFAFIIGSLPPNIGFAQEINDYYNPIV